MVTCTFRISALFNCNCIFSTITQARKLKSTKWYFALFGVFILSHLGTVLILLQIIGKPVIIQDERLDIRALAWTETCPFSTKELTALLADRAPLHRWLLNQPLDSKAPPCTELDLDIGGWARCVAAVVIEGKLSGYLSILGQAHDLDDLDRLATEHGSLVCAVEMAKQLGFEYIEGLEVMGAQFGVLDLDVSHGGVRRAVPHHPGQHQKRHAAAGHGRPKAVAIMPSSA